MPFTPELFSAPVLERLQAQGRHELASVPYFDGLLAGEPDALVKSFAAVPELHDPVRGRVKGARAFEAFVSEASSWLRRHRERPAALWQAASSQGNHSGTMRAVPT
jgi:hypothetical protein